MAEILDIVNEKDEIIGQAPRDEVHEKGLTCRMVYVWFYTPDKQLILQRRSLTKKNHPGRLTTAVSGHVESGMGYAGSAIKETLEETGVSIASSELVDAGVVHARYEDEAASRYISDAMRASFLYRYDGDVATLKVEDGEGAGFELWPVDDLLPIEEGDTRFVTFLTSPHARAILQRIQSL